MMMQEHTGTYEKGLVSVITPVFNGEKYVSRLLQSVLDQTYPLVEMILVDDGSEDQTVLTAEHFRGRFAEKGYRFVVIQTSHKNASAALNRGLPQVRGEYLIWPDSDDRLHPESIERRVAFLAAHPQYNCVRSLFSCFDDQTGIPVEQNENLGDLRKEDLFWDVLESKTFVCCGCYMLRTQCFFEIYPERKIPEYHVGQNFQMLLPFLYHYPCPTMEQALYEVAIREGSHSRKHLSEEEEVRKYEAFERLIDKIATICGIRDKTSQKRLLRWKLRRQLELARRLGKRCQAIRVLWRLCRSGAVFCCNSGRF